MNELNNSSLKGLSRDKHGRVFAASVSGCRHRGQPGVFSRSASTLAAVQKPPDDDGW